MAESRCSEDGQLEHYVKAFVEHPRLSKYYHGMFFAGHMKDLPEHYTSMHTNRVTVLHFAVTGLDMLGELETHLPTGSPQRRAVIEWVYSLQVPTGGFVGTPHLAVREQESATESAAVDKGGNIMNAGVSEWSGRNDGAGNGDSNDAAIHTLRLPSRSTASALTSASASTLATIITETLSLARRTSTSLPAHAHLPSTYSALCVLLALGDDLQRVHVWPLLCYIRSLQMMAPQQTSQSSLRHNHHHQQSLLSSTAPCNHATTMHGAVCASATMDEADTRFLYCACVIPWLLALKRPLEEEGVDVWRERVALVKRQRMEQSRRREEGQEDQEKGWKTCKMKGKGGGCGGEDEYGDRSKEHQEDEALEAEGGEKVECEEADMEMVRWLDWAWNHLSEPTPPSPDSPLPSLTPPQAHTDTRDSTPTMPSSSSSAPDSSPPHASNAAPISRSPSSAASSSCTSASCLSYSSPPRCTPLLAPGHPISALHSQHSLTTTAKTYLYLALSRTRAQTYLRACRSWDGGYALTPGAEGHGGATYTAIASFFLLSTNNESRFLNEKYRNQPTTTSLYNRNGENTYSQENTSRFWPQPENNMYRSVENPLEVMHWAMKNQGAGYRGRIGKPCDCCYSFWTGATLSLLGLNSLLSPTSNLAFNIACEGPRGGFGKEPGAGAEILHSFYGVAGLSLMQHEAGHAATVRRDNHATNMGKGTGRGSASADPMSIGTRDSGHDGSTGLSDRAGDDVTGIVDDEWSLRALDTALGITRRATGIAAWIPMFDVENECLYRYSRW